ncbi:MAG: alpha-glucan family phosphorylase [bacterium]
MIKSSYEVIASALPPELHHLKPLALNLRWSWSHVADALWRYIDEDLWAQTQNPWMILQTVSHTRLKHLAADEEFLALLQQLRTEQEDALQQAGWLQQAFPGESLPVVAYFSMEFGITEALPIYSGGLGVLAGDHLKSCSESGLPLCGVGLLYQQGYFRQGIDSNGMQMEFYPYNDPTQLPIQPARDEAGEWVHVSIQLPGRDLRLRVWKVVIGRNSLYLLDSNSPLNSPADRGVTAELYGGGAEMRLQQEMVLGIGGYRALQALGISPDVCHLNEGHAAFVLLERAHHAMEKYSLSFEEAMTATRAGNLFTTHTPVEAGFDRFEAELFWRYMESTATRLSLDREEMLSLGWFSTSREVGLFNMAILAMRGCGGINAVSALHGEVSRKMFVDEYPRWPEAEVPIGHVTNGVHVPTWDSEAADVLWTRYFGKARWRTPQQAYSETMASVPEAALWEMRAENRMAMIKWLRQRVTRQNALSFVPHRLHHDDECILNPNALTIGFARRFAEYKRSFLLLQDRARLAALLNNPHRPVQLVIAGKAHPSDKTGKALIQRWINFIADFQMQAHVIFVVDYDLEVAKQLVQGVDLWVNTPRRPWEASGTSGMKVLVNGGLNVSELDGWWAEAYVPEVGWSLGDGLEHDHDTSYDLQEAEQLYTLLEQQIIPEFYLRNDAGIPSQWVERIRHSMGALTPEFCTNRMVKEYFENYYRPMAENVRFRLDHEARAAKEIAHWKQTLKQHWGALQIADVRREIVDGAYVFTAQVYLDDLEAEDVKVQLFADKEGGHGVECHDMERIEALTGAVHGYNYRLALAAHRKPDDYTVRIVPNHEHVAVPLELASILWEH